jgi:peptidoglycan/xylan/chitin deacetylase (PgdA/CDA1 family)
MPQEYYYPVNVDNHWILHLDLFYAQMRYLYDNGFHTLTAQQLIDFLFYGGDLPPNPIVITFDDGYIDNALFAAPILRQFGFTAIMFLVTSSIPNETPVMTYRGGRLCLDQIFAISDVFEFGSHTHQLHHFYARDTGHYAALELASVEEIQKDLRRSFEFPLNTPAFSYPFGRHTEDAVTALQAEGIRLAFATHWGYASKDSDPFRLPRFLITCYPDSAWNDLGFFSNIVRGRR